MLKRSNPKQVPALAICEDSLEAAFAWLKNSAAGTYSPVDEDQLTNSFARLLAAQLKTGTAPADSTLLALVWAVGSLARDRTGFDAFVKTLPLMSKTHFPESASVFECGLTRENHKDIWKHLAEYKEVAILPPSLVPVPELMAQLSVLSLLADQGVPTLLAGPSATGKTAAMHYLKDRFASSLHTAELPLGNPPTCTQMR